MSWLDGNAEGIALMLVMGVIGVLLLLGALCIERLVDPLHEREEFKHLTRVDRARQKQRTEVDEASHRERIRVAADLIAKNGWQGPEGTR